MSLNDVKVVINLTQPIRKAGFGYPLILESGATEAKDYTEVKSLSEVEAAGYKNTTYVYALANAIFMQENAPDKIAVCSTTGTALDWVNDELNTNKEWRQLIVAAEMTAEELTALSNGVEATQCKMLFVTFDEDAVKDVKSNDRTVFVVATEDTNNVSHAVVVGESAGRTVGSFTYKNLIVKGCEPLDLTSAELGEYQTANANVIVYKAGDIVTSDGYVASGEYIDIIDSKDYVVQQITYRTQKLLNSAAKIPYDNNGIAMLETVVADVLQDCFNKGMIATNEDGSPAYSVEFALRENCDKTDIAARKYVGGQFKFTLAGAIHEVEITGEITV